MSARNTDFTNEMKTMVDAFFENATPEEFQQLLTDIDYAYYRTVTVPVLAQQPRSQTIRRDRVLLPFLPQAVGFLDIISCRDLEPASDHEEVALAA